MRITDEQIELVESDPYRNFLDGCKSQRTKETYEACLKKALMEHFDDILSAKTVKDRAAEFVDRAKRDPKWLSKVLKTYVKEFKKRCLLPPENPDFVKPITIDNYIFAIKKLTDTNEIPLVWKSVFSLLPEKTSYEETRGYFKNEIQKMLDVADADDRAIILTACSSGIRKGGFDLKWKNLIPVYSYNGKLLWDVEDVTESVTEKGKVVCALLSIYDAEPKSNYVAFLTPEAWNSLQVYRDTWPSTVKHFPKPDDPLFKQRGLLVRPLTPMGVYTRIVEVAKKSNLRPPLVKGKRRQKIPTMNGLRKFFNKQNKESLSHDSILAQLIKKEIMMGHTGLIKLDKSYFKTQVLELVEEYLNAVPNLTITKEETLRLENEQKQNKISELEKKNSKIDEVEQRFQKKFDLLQERLDESEDMITTYNNWATDPKLFCDFLNRIRNSKEIESEFRKVLGRNWKKKARILKEKGFDLTEYFEKWYAENEA